MKKIHIDSPSHPLFSTFWQIYEYSFPAHEKRSLEQMKSSFLRPEFRVDAYTKENQFLGFIAYWEFDSYVYIEYYAMNKACRGGGLGTTILREFIETHAKTIILDIDPIEDEISARRKGFYERLGFVLNPHKHLYPSYTAGEAPFELLLMTTPGVISKQEYEVFSDILARVIIDAW